MFWQVYQLTFKSITVITKIKFYIYKEKEKMKDKIVGVREL